MWRRQYFWPIISGLSLIMSFFFFATTSLGKFSVTYGDYAFPLLLGSSGTLINYYSLVLKEYLIDCLELSQHQKRVLFRFCSHYGALGLFGLELK